MFWDKPRGGLLVGYSRRIRRGNQRRSLGGYPARGHSLGRRVPRSAHLSMAAPDPADVVVGIRAANVHRHSDPSPETHLAADYMVLVGLLGRDGEPRTSLAPNRPHFELVPRQETVPPLERICWIGRRNRLSMSSTTTRSKRYYIYRTPDALGRSQQFYRAAQTSAGWTRDSCSLPPAANPLLDRPMGCPDLTILTMTRRSSHEMHFEIEHSIDDAPRWSSALQQGEAAKMAGVGDGRLFELFGANSPGCWALATRLVAMHVSGSDRWLTGAGDDVQRAYVECWEGSMIGGHVYQDLQVGCYRDFRSGLVVHVESDDGERSKELDPEGARDEQVTRALMRVPVGAASHSLGPCA